MLRAYLPVILVLLAIFTAGCIIYIAWELSADASKPQDADPHEQEGKDGS